MDGAWVACSANVRMDGVNTPESDRRIEKYKRHVIAIADYLQERSGLRKAQREALDALVGARVAYLGKMEGVVSQAFGHHFADVGIRIAPAYTLLGADKRLNDTLDLWDRFGRIIGRIMAGGENQGEDLIAGFLEFVLPGAMKKEGEEYLTAYKEEVAPYRDVLSEWKKSSGRNEGLRELYKLLHPGTAPVPSHVYSKEMCARFAELWTKFVGEFPRVANDLQTMTALIGTGPPYVKYPGHMSPVDLIAEQFALRGYRKGSRGYGLARDTVYRFLRPSGELDDPWHSPVYHDRGLYMSGIKDLKDLDPLHLRKWLREQAAEDVLFLQRRHVTT